MIERAVIVSAIDKYHFTVRIPSLNKSENAIGSTPDEELYKAVVSSTSGVHPSLRKGDVVIVGFENGNVSCPVIIGQLFNKRFESIQSDSSFSSLEVIVNASLPEDTRIGTLTPANIFSLKNLDLNVKEKFINIDQLHQKYESEIELLKSSIDELRLQLLSLKSNSDE